MGRIFAIKKYAIHDGPNIRTTVFFKGCPLQCWWCHNPEGMDSTIAMLWDGRKCVDCGECVAACPTGSLYSAEKGIQREPASCNSCLTCLDTCPAMAHETTGWEASVEEVMTEIEKDIPFYDTSGGGVTFSGGEPLMQPQFLLDLLKACGRLGLHRAVDTTVYADPATILAVAKHCELFLVDLKHMDTDKHKLYTGVGNGRILANIRLLAEQGKQMRIRIPLIEGINSDRENMERSAAFLAPLPAISRVDVLPYHNIAAAKYHKLGRTYNAEACSRVAPEKVSECIEILRKSGLVVEMGG